MSNTIVPEFSPTAKYRAAEDDEIKRIKRDSAPIFEGDPRFNDLVSPVHGPQSYAEALAVGLTPKDLGEMWASRPARMSGYASIWPGEKPEWATAMPTVDSITAEDGFPAVTFEGKQHKAVVNGAEVADFVVQREDILNTQDDRIERGETVIGGFVGGNWVGNFDGDAASAIAYALLSAGSELQAIDRDELMPKGPVQWPLRHFRDGEEIPLFKGDFVALDEAAAEMGKSRLELTYAEVMKIIFEYRDELGREEYPPERPGWHTTLADETADPDDPNNRDVKILVYDTAEAAVEVERLFTSNPWIVYLNISLGETDSTAARELAAALVKAADLADELNAEVAR